MIRSRSFGVLVAVAVMLGSAPLSSGVRAQGDPPGEALTAAKELFALMSPEMIGQIASQLMTQLWPLVERDLAQKLDRATIAELRKEFERIQVENLTEVMKEGPPIYARNFTASELRELAGFYRTPIGQKTLKVLPKVTSDLMQAIAPRMQSVAAQTQERFIKILRDRGYAQ
jgi:hypothetical protein